MFFTIRVGVFTIVSFDNTSRNISISLKDNQISSFIVSSSLVIIFGQSLTFWNWWNIVSGLEPVNWTSENVVPFQSPVFVNQFSFVVWVSKQKVDSSCNTTSSKIAPTVVPVDKVFNFNFGLPSKR